MRSRPRATSSGTRAGALLAAALLAAAPGRASAGVLTRAELSRRFRAPFLVAEREKDVPVWPIFRQGGPPSFTVELVGYVFESVDLAPVPGFSGTPVDLLVALGTQGEFLDVAVLSQHEPVFVGGVGEEPLFRFLAQYKGLNLKQSVTVGGGGAKVSHPGSANVYLDGIAKATASLRIINQSVLASALRVARARLGFAGRDPDGVARERADLFEPRGWDELVRAGLLQHRVILNRDVERAFAGREGAGLDPEARASPDEIFCDLWVGLLTVPTAGRNLLTDAAWKTMNDRIRPGDHVLLVAARGRHRFVTEVFQRNTVPDALTLQQGGLPIEMRDLDVDAPLRRLPGEPAFDLAMTFRVISQAGLDPGQPMRLTTRVTRSRGTLYAARFTRDFALDYAVPARFLVPAPDDGRSWVAPWKARAPDLGVLVAALAFLAWVLARQSSLVSEARRLRWFRPLFLSFTVAFVGWWAQAQLSIVNVVALVQATLAGRSWAFYLYDPLVTVVSAFAVVTLVVWGRGTFCGWVCPFGALQELVASGARLARVPRLRPGARWDRRLKAVKYPVLAGIVLAAATSPRWGDALVELEPFKTAITLHFGRTWPFVAWAAATLACGAVVYKAFCRYLCPLGAALALLGRVRRLAWIARRVECGNPCQTCKGRCEYQAIHPDGRVDYAECFQCMECVAVYRSDELCTPRLLARIGKPMRPSGSRPPPLPSGVASSRGAP